jgi:hypothetical protein
MTSSVGDNGGPAASTLSDPPTPFAATAATVDGEAPVPPPDQIADVDVMILATRSRIRRERGRRARLTQQLERLNAAIKTLRGMQGTLRTAARGDGGNDDGNVQGVGAARAGGGMENLKESVRRAVDRHEELGAWNSRAVEAVRNLDRIKVNQEGGGNLLFVFYLHLGMGEIHWREDGDPMINRICKIEIFFYVRDIWVTVKIGIYKI